MASTTRMVSGNFFTTWASSFTGWATAVEVSFVDSGSGIPAEIRDKIHEFEERADEPQ